MANYCTILLKLVLHQNLKEIWKASTLKPEKLIQHFVETLSHPND
jgi:hypothetical protein